VIGVHFIHPSNYHPSLQRMVGVLAGGSIISSPTSASTRLYRQRRVRDAQRTVPIGIIATLIVCTILTSEWRWCSPASCRGSRHRRRRSGSQRPQALTISEQSALLHWTRSVVLLGAIIGMVSSILVFQLGQARVWFAMSRDRLLPDMFSRVHKRFRTPAIATWIAGILVAIPAGSGRRTLSELSTIGTLFAFVLVSIGVLLLRKKTAPTPPRLPRPRRPHLPDPQHRLLHPPMT